MALGSFGGLRGPGALSGVFARRRPARSGAGRDSSPEDIVAALYRALLGREPDRDGLAGKLGAIGSGATLETIIAEFVSSPEFRARQLRDLVPPAALPDLTRLMPERYAAAQPGVPMRYLARGDGDIDAMERLIREHRYYDRFGVWSPVIDDDKRIIAAIVRGLGARSCFEMGCFTGPVLSLLADAGVAVAGCELSHTAFAFAYPNVRGAMLFGDLLDLAIGRKFDAILCMDVLEHLNPLRLDRYVARLASLLDDGGRLYLNSPMFGRDEVFGTAAEQTVDEWRAVGDAGFWREWPCDEAGWPEHGHLVWASPNWWTALFAARGLQRDVLLERVIHYRLDRFFEQAPGRRSLFVLRHANGRAATADDAAALDATLAALPGLAR